MSSETTPEPSPYARARAWGRRHPWAAAGLIILVLAMLLILLLAIFPNRGPAWTGFGLQPHPNGWVMIPYKTLWDWMELLLVPLFIGLAAAAIGHRQQQRGLAQQEHEAALAAESRANEQAIARERSEQEELEAYYVNMGKLLLDYGLGSADEGPQARTLARARTLIALEGLNGARKGQLLRFLYEAGLIRTPDPVVDLFGANLDDLLLRFGDLRGAALAGVWLRDAQLLGADLRGADLGKAHLNRAMLRCADLRGAAAAGARFSGCSLRDAALRDADLSGAKLSLADAAGLDLRGARLAEAVLDGADLSGALLHGADLATAVFAPGDESHPFSLHGARYDAATRWPDGFDPHAAGAVAGAPAARDDDRCRRLAEQYRRDE